MNVETPFKVNIKFFAMVLSLWVIVALSEILSPWMVLLIIPYILYFFGKKSFIIMVSNLAFFSILVIILVSKNIYKDNFLSSKSILFSIRMVLLFIASISSYFVLFLISRWALKTLTLDVLKRLPDISFSLRFKILDSLGFLSWAFFTGAVLLFYYGLQRGPEHFLYYLGATTVLVGVGAALKDGKENF